MARIFVCHPYCGDPEGNRASVARVARRLALEGHLPLVPQLSLPAFLDEGNDRKAALRLCLGLVAMSEEVRIYGEPTEGMRLEIAEARRLGIPIVDGADHAG